MCTGAYVEFRRHGRRDRIISGNNTTFGSTTFGSDYRVPSALVTGMGIKAVKA